jgi:hypothetical protein
MFRIVSHIVDAGANFCDLAQPLAYTSTSSGRMYLAILGGLAEIERELIASRSRGPRPLDQPHGAAVKADARTASGGAEAQSERRTANRYCPLL